MVNRVLAEPSFSEAAQNVSTRMRAHRLKPAEKAAGAGTCSYLSRHAMVCALRTPPHMHASSCCSTPEDRDLILSQAYPSGKLSR